MPLKHLQRTSKASKTLETYIYNIEERSLGPVNSSLGVGAGGARAPSARVTLMGALGSAETDLRRTMAPPAPIEAGSAALPDLVRIAGSRRRGRMRTELRGEEERRRSSHRS